MSEKKCCPICNSKDTVVFANTTDLEYLSSETVYTYHECKSCSTIFIDEFPTDKLSEIYPSNYYSFLVQKKNLALRFKEYLDKRHFKKVLSEFQGKSINILDIGGGSGWLLDIIKSVYKHVNITQVVDIDENANATVSLKLIKPLLSVLFFSNLLTASVIIFKSIEGNVGLIN
jgi:hypothetical protein